jgi:hypothetical protein
MPFLTLLLACQEYELVPLLGDPFPTEGEGDGGDGCYEPEDGYDRNPEARFVVTGSEAVTIELLGSESGYTSEVWVDGPVEQGPLFDNRDPAGTAVAVGPYDLGEELILGLVVESHGLHWQTGPRERNADGRAHATVAFTGECTWRLGFEDLHGGGDQDFNDVVVEVSGLLRQER